MLTGTQKRIEELEHQLHGAYMLLWLLANRKDGTLTISAKELRLAGAGGKIKTTAQPNGDIIVEAL